LASAKGRFAFASTLAVYIYSTKNFQLEKILSHCDSNISCIEWDPNEEKYLA
jgi:hypothetical protein